MMNHIHLIGIGGSGLSAIAGLLLESGYRVSGSDRQLSALTADLSKAGATIYAGHQAENIAGADVVVRSSAIADDNPEVRAAHRAGIAVLKRAEFLGQLFAAKTTLAIAGTHGKTTTTAMAAWVFHCLQLDPTFLIGGAAKNLATNAHAGQGKYAIIEADEYDRMFLGLNPQWIIINHLEHDHPDCFPTMEDYRQAFIDFLQRLRPGGGLITCRDFSETTALIALLPPETQAWTYGLSTEADYVAENPTPNARGGLDFTARIQHGSLAGQTLAHVSLQIAGLHNVRNALAVLALVDRLGLSAKAAGEALEQFSGVGRRFERIGTAGGITVYSDYAHHPTEIRATLAAARLRHPHARLWAIWQPHTYSRTQTLFDAFTQAFQDADRVVVTEVYAAREQSNGFSAARLVVEIQQPPAWFAPTLDDARAFLREELAAGDVVIILSAGDADQIGPKLLAELTNGGTTS